MSGVTESSLIKRFTQGEKIGGKSSCPRALNCIILWNRLNIANNNIVKSNVHALLENKGDRERKKEGEINKYIIYWERDRERQRDRETATDRQTDRQTERQRQTDRQGLNETKRRKQR